MNKKILLSILVTLSFGIDSFSQDLEPAGNADNFAANVHSGNKVSTKFYNNGLVGRNRGEGLEVSGIWPSGTPNSYFGDVAPVIGVEYEPFYEENGQLIYGTKSINVPVAKGPRIGSYPEGGFSALEGYLNTTNTDSLSIAMSHLPETYPQNPWPDQPTWVDNNGNTQWNGFFGRDVKNADQESYFVFDDNLDSRPNAEVDINGNTGSYIPNPTEDPTRKGLGMLIRTRGLQWAQRLAQDNIFWLYEITNTSEHDWDRTVFGMVVGTLVGGEGDSNDDLAEFRLGEEITYSEDIDDDTDAPWVNVSSTRRIGVVGYAFLEAPGNPVDGIDNDGDSVDPNTPTFTIADFDTNTFTACEKLVGDGEGNVVLITEIGQGQDKTLSREIITLPQTGEIQVVTHGETFTISRNTTACEIANDQKDNDFDGLIDESFEIHYDKRIFSGQTPSKYINYFTGEGLSDLLVDERRDDDIDNDGDWTNDDDVGADGLGPSDPGYPGPDFGEGDGVPTSGEPHFDKTDITESDQIGLTSFDLFKSSDIFMSQAQALWDAMEPGFFDENVGVPDDWDFLYGAGFAPLNSKRINRFSVSLLYGETPADIRRNKDVVQRIYDENYQFAQAPIKPTLWAYPGDGKVTLYWDRVSEESYDSFFETNDFQGYKLYRSTDPNFRDVFTGTDAFGSKTFNIPIAQWDKIDGIEGVSPYVDNTGTGFYLGEDTGLTHSFVDSGLVNGVTYYYAITGYDVGGEVEGLVIPPTENSISISAIDGEIITLDKNTVVVTPNQSSPGFEEAEISELIHTQGTSSAEVIAKILNSFEYTEDRTYRFEFYSWESDEIDNDLDWKRWVDLNANDVYDFGVDQAFDDVGSDGNPDVFDADGTQGNGKPDAGEPNVDENDPDEFDLEAYFTTSAFSVYEIIGNEVDTIFYKNTDVPNILESTENKVDFINGMEFYVRNPSQVDYDPIASGWEIEHDSTMTISASLFSSGGGALLGTRLSYDYSIEFGVKDSSIAFGATIQPKETNFKIRNLDLGTDAEFIFIEDVDTVYTNEGEIDYAKSNLEGEFDNGDRIVLQDVNPVNGEKELSWFFKSFLSVTKEIRPEVGDKWFFRTKKPLHGGNENRVDVGDIYEITIKKADVDLEVAKNSLDKIKVVPNPYVANSIFDKPHIERSIGRERRIRFTHLPQKATIRIFNVRGELVQTLNHDSTAEDGDQEWNLRNRNNQDVAFGLYFYHVDAPGVGEKKGKFALIK